MPAFFRAFSAWSTSPAGVALTATSADRGRSCDRGRRRSAPAILALPEHVEPRGDQVEQRGRGLDRGIELDGAQHAALPMDDARFDQRLGELLDIERQAVGRRLDPPGERRLDLAAGHGLDHLAAAFAAEPVERQPRRPRAGSSTCGASGASGTAPVGPRLEAAMSRSTSSRVEGSIQCASSRTSSTGAGRASINAAAAAKREPRPSGPSAVVAAPEGSEDLDMRLGPGVRAAEPMPSASRASCGLVGARGVQVARDVSRMQANGEFCPAWVPASSKTCERWMCAS